MDIKLIEVWYDYFKQSGDIPVSEHIDDYEWIEDNHELILDWIINTYIPESGYDKFVMKDHLTTLSKVLTLCDTVSNQCQYEDVVNDIGNMIKKIDSNNDKVDNAYRYSKEYREANRERIKEKRARDYILKKGKILSNKILDNLNSGITKKPRQSTINKYNLHYDGEKWMIDHNMRNGI